LLPIVLDEAIVQSLMQRPDDELTVDIEARELRTPAGEVHAFPLDAFARTCLMEGVDEMGYLLLRSEQIARYESASAPIGYA
jgi:3-isopropylmalate/(R)-2-methylmalate dehydratase small subunit